MRAYDSYDDELHLKSINTRKILENTMTDLGDLLSRDALLYFLRIAILILGYIVIRPLIEACFRRAMTPQEPVDELGKKQNIRQQSLADELLVDSEDELGDDDSGKAEWGGTLRKRQKAKFMEAWEDEQARLAEEEELRELEDLLED